MNASHSQVTLHYFCEGCGKETTPFTLCSLCKEERENPSSVNKFEYISLVEGNHSTQQTSNTHKMSTLSITPQQIIDFRAARKASGMAGCITGRPTPELDFFGYKDVQSWRPADPMQPHCFCFDCRELWDSDASIDVQLIQNGHKMALWTYEQILPKGSVPPRDEAPRPALPLPMPSGGISRDEVPLLARTMTEHPEARGWGAVPPLRVDTSVRTYGSFSEVPMSLPAPRHRDVMNESHSERIRGDLAELKGQLQSELVVTMDRRRNAVCYDDGDEKAAFLAQVAKDEAAIWAKLDAVTLLLNE